MSSREDRLRALRRGETRAVPPRQDIPRIAILLLIAFLLRAPLYGDPVIHSDEQFYLLVGDRMLHGALPYVDIWDRKPIGLFAIFAGARLLGGTGVLAYQLVATLFAAATAWLIARIADRATNAPAATFAGALYLIWLMIFDGAGGQAPVFYNLFVAGAALLTLDAVVRPAEAFDRRAAGAMALMGIAIQVKYTVAVEGAFFGLTLLWALRRRDAPYATLAARAALWIGLALLPTLAVLAFYAAVGHAEAFVYANFLSAFDRASDEPPPLLAEHLASALAGLLPLLACAAWRARRATDRASDHFLLAWAGAAFAGILAVGTMRAHYFLPLLVPLAAMAAPAFDRSGRLNRPLAAVVALLGLVAGFFVVRDHIARRGNADQIAALVRLIGQRPPGCLFAFGSEPILYHLTQSCLPTPYIFRSHLSQTREAQAIGVPPRAEVARILANRPGVIVVRATKDNTNPVTEALVESTLARDYRLAGTVVIGKLPHAVYKRR
jgi:hypothetical protein